MSEETATEKKRKAVEEEKAEKPKTSKPKPS